MCTTVQPSHDGGDPSGHKEYTGKQPGKAIAAAPERNIACELEQADTMTLDLGLIRLDTRRPLAARAPRTD